MNVIEVRPCKKFKGAWVAFEAPGIEPAFARPDAKRKAIDYACNRFGGRAGEVHVFDRPKIFSLNRRTTLSEFAS